MKRKDPSFTFACIAIVAGLLAAFASAVQSARGLQAEITSAVVAEH